MRPIQRSTVTDQVLEQLGALIRTGEIQPGDKLPNERELGEMFGTTRARIREALRALALIGLIETRPGAGSYVTKNHEIPEDTMELLFYKERAKFSELYAARAVIEPPIFQLAARNIKKDQLHRLCAILEECQQVIQSDGEPKQFLELVNEFDRIIGMATENSVLSKLMDVFVCMKESANLTIYRVSGAMQNSILQRCKIVDALRVQDMDLLQSALAEHFSSAAPFYSEVHDAQDAQ